MDEERTMPYGTLQYQCTNLYPVLNRRAPSAKTYINGLPTELLRIIFIHYCDTDNGPLPLLLVCRLWQTIVSDCPTLWSAIRYIAGPPSHRKQVLSRGQLRGPCPIICSDMSKMRWAISRAKSSALEIHLQADIANDFHFGEGSIEDALHVAQWRQLCLRLQTREKPSPALTPLGNLPTLEHLGLEGVFTAETDEFLDRVQAGSPLLRSLSIRGPSFPGQLAGLKLLMKRIRKLELCVPMCTQEDIVGFENVTELLVRKSLDIPPLAFPKLVSLAIWNTQFAFTANGIITLPVLDTLALHGHLSNLSLISAPRLTKLVLRYEEHPNLQIMGVLRRATVRPRSLVISDRVSDINFPELLTSWSDLRELHLECAEEASMLSQIFTMTLAENTQHGMLCSHLRYLTVHVKQRERDLTMTDQIIRMLHMIVDKRKQHGDTELQRVMCVWDWCDSVQCNINSKELEWVDIL